MPLRIMVLSESFQLCRDAIRYSIAVAKRLDAHLVLLMLVPLESTQSLPRDLNTVLKLQTRGEAAIRRPIKEMEKAGISVESAVRVGNPRSELL